MFFHAAGIEVAPWLPPLVAFAISFFTCMGGVSGAFLLLPFQVSVLGYVHPSVSATNHLFNIVAIPSGVYRYWKEGRMVWPLTWVVVAGTLPGVFIGAFIRVAWLPDPRHFKLFAAAVLLYIGGRLAVDLARKGRGAVVSCGLRASAPSAADLPAVSGTQLSRKRLDYTYQGEHFSVSVWGVFALSFVVGIIGGTYGIGGGSIIAPFFVTFFGLPVHTVAGAALMGTCVTSVAGVGFYQIIAPLYPKLSVAPDWRLGLLFGLGGAAGMYLGARCQKFVPARIIKTMLAGVILFTAVRYLTEFFFSP
ncbi:MAG: sulfite exporter TauE/SafE family protein [Thermodesulfobacteriota bacterium]